MKEFAILVAAPEDTTESELQAFAEAKFDDSDLEVIEVEEQ